MRNRLLGLTVTGRAANFDGATHIPSRKTPKAGFGAKAPDPKRGSPVEMGDGDGANARGIGD